MMARLPPSPPTWWERHDWWDEDSWPVYVMEIVTGVAIIGSVIFERYLLAAAYALLFVMTLLRVRDRTLCVSFVVAIALALAPLVPTGHFWSALNWLDDRYHAHLDDGIQWHKEHLRQERMQENLQWLLKDSERRRAQP